MTLVCYRENTGTRIRDHDEHLKRKSHRAQEGENTGMFKVKPGDVCTAITDAD